MYIKVLCVLCLCEVARTQVIPGKSRTSDGEYNSVNVDGSFDFGYANKDTGSSYHLARGNANRVVGGRFGSRDPATGTIKETVYTAGPRGFRARGPNVHRKMDLDQRPRGPIGNKDDPYFDPNEDPSYAFSQNTRTYSKTESADSRGDVKGHYSYIDDIGERHDVSYIAGRDTGFHVTSAHPDSPSVIGAPFHRAPLVRGETRPRGRTAVQRGLDGSYRFISAGPDQRRTESSDAHGNVRGSYSFLDDKGVQRTVHYIAGPGIGYRIVKSGKDPYIPAYFPTIPSVYDPDFASIPSVPYVPDDIGADDIFKRPDGTAASGHVKPPPFSSGEKDKSSKRLGSSTARTPANSGSAEEDITGDADSVYHGPSVGHGTGIGDDDDGFVDEEASSIGGVTPSKVPGKPTGIPGASTGITGRPTSGPSQATSVTGRPSSIPERPTSIPGRQNNRPSRPPYKSYRPTKKPYVPLKPTQIPANKDDSDNDYSVEKDKNTQVYNVKFDINHTKPGSTIIRNIGEDFFAVPPGVSVRAHVQSIDLYPFESKPISPSEAIEKDKSKT